MLSSSTYYSIGLTCQKRGSGVIEKIDNMITLYYKLLLVVKPVFYEGAVTLTPSTIQSIFLRLYPVSRYL